MLPNDRGLTINSRRTIMKGGKGFLCDAWWPQNIYRVMLDWTQIIDVARDRTSQRDAYFAILQARNALFTRPTN